VTRWDKGRAVYLSQNKNYETRCQINTIIINSKVSLYNNFHAKCVEEKIVVSNSIGSKLMKCLYIQRWALDVFGDEIMD